MKFYYIVLITLFSTILLHAQDISRFNCDVKLGTEKLASPFAGGLNAPQFSQMDVNQDQFEDLIVFDRLGDKLNVFINNPNKPGHYIFAPEFNSLFPEVKHWMLLADYNNDGIKDLFKSGGSQDIEVWKGEIKNSKLTFTKYINPYKHSLFQYDVLSTKIQSGKDQKIEHLNSDIPSIVDIDNDGDIDILTFGAGSSIRLYKNICNESGISRDSFKFILTKSCWGRFQEATYSDDINLSDNPYRCAESVSIENRHSGSTNLVLDMDNDGDFDILIGDIGYDSLIYLKNGGNENNAWMTEMDRNFPKNDKSIALKAFLAPFSIDIDSDGKKDLLIAPNSTYDYDIPPQNIQNVHYYKNNGAGFTFSNKNFLVEDMIDLGGQVYPTFVDINGDGLLDIIVGTGPKITFDNISPSYLNYFKNIGTINEPAFELVDDDFLNMSQISKEHNLNYLTPAFGDIDGDNDLDLLIGNHTGSLIYLENTAGAGQACKFANPVLNFKNLTSLNNSAPCIYDFNNDGKGDIILGAGFNFNDGIHSYGAAIYFENIGSNKPDFDSDAFSKPNSNFFGKLLYDSENLFYSNGYFSAYKTKNEDYLFAGFTSGHVNIYKDFTNYKYEKLTPFKKYYGNIDSGENSSPAVADIDNDGYLELLIGTSRGGLEFYNTDIKIDEGSATFAISVSNLVEIYPNPASNYLTIDIKSGFGKDIKYKLTNLWGKTVSYGNIGRGYNNVNLKKFNSGVYFLTLSSEKNTYCKKIIKTNN